MLTNLTAPAPCPRGPGALEAGTGERVRHGVRSSVRVDQASAQSEHRRAGPRDSRAQSAGCEGRSPNGVESGHERFSHGLRNSIDQGATEEVQIA